MDSLVTLSQGLEEEEDEPEGEAYPVIDILDFVPPAATHGGSVVMESPGTMPRMLRDEAFRLLRNVKSPIVLFVDVETGNPSVAYRVGITPGDSEVPDPRQSSEEGILFVKDPRESKS